MRKTNRTAYRAGLLWCAASLLLVTFAQLTLKWAVLRIPATGRHSFFQNLADWPLATLGAGIFGYALSMGCWFFALRRLPLNYAYPLLSLSYVFVYLLAGLLPCFNEILSAPGSIGVLLILLGVWLISREHGGTVEAPAELPTKKPPARPEA